MTDLRHKISDLADEWESEAARYRPYAESVATKLADNARALRALLNDDVAVLARQAISAIGDGHRAHWDGKAAICPACEANMRIRADFRKRLEALTNEVES